MTLNSNFSDIDEIEVDIKITAKVREFKQIAAALEKGDSLGFGYAPKKLLTEINNQF